VFVPLALAFVIASRHGATRARRRGTLVLIEGCVVEIAGLALLALTLASIAAPSASLLALVLTMFGYGQGLIMAPLSSAVLSSVKPASAGSGSGMYGTTAQIANAAGVAAIGAVFFAIEAARSARPAFFASLALFALSIVACAAFSGLDAGRTQLRLTAITRGLTAHGLFILQCSNYLGLVGLELSPPRRLLSVPRQKCRILATSAEVEWNQWLWGVRTRPKAKPAQSFGRNHRVWIKSGCSPDALVCSR